MHPHTSMSSYPLFHSLSLSHISSFTSSSPTLSPSPLHIPHFFISHGFFPPYLFIFHRFFPYLFISPIDCTLNLLFKLSTTHYPNNWWCARNFFLCPLCFCGGLCMKDAKFFPFVLWLDLWILWYVLLLDLYYLFIFYWICGFWTLGYSFVVVCIFFPISFLIGVVCSFVFFVMVKLDLFCFVVWVLIYIYIVLSKFDDT